MLDSLEEVLAKASEDDIRAWHIEVSEGRWPSTMPMTREALDTVWHKLHRRAFSLPPKKAGKP